MIHSLEWLHLKGKYTKRLQGYGATGILIQCWWKIQHVTGTMTNNVAVPYQIKHHVTSNSTPRRLPSMIHSVWDYRTLSITSAVWRYTWSLCSPSTWDTASQHCVLVFKSWICLAMLRFGVVLQGEKYNWSSLQVLSRAGGNFRPTNLYFIFLFKKLFNSLISQCTNINTGIFCYPTKPKHKVNKM